MTTIPDISELDQIAIGETQPPSAPDTQTAQEEEDLIKTAYALQLKRLKILNDGLKQDRKERRKYAERIFLLIVGWVFAILFIIIFKGFGSYYNFELSDKVLITLIGGTTINVLGIFIIVANYLFKQPTSAKATSAKKTLAKKEKK